MSLSGKDITTAIKEIREKLNSAQEAIDDLSLTVREEVSTQDDILAKLPEDDESRPDAEERSEDLSELAGQLDDLSFAIDDLDIPVWSND